MPGTGSRTASAGRCTPRRRRRPKVAAAIVAPVEPWLTIASALPSATSRAARTTEASFFARTAGTGSSSLPIHSVVGTTSIPSTPASPSSSGPEDAEPNPVRGGHPRALGQHLEALLGTEAIEGDGHAGRGIVYSVSGAGAVGSTIECSITSRPL